MLSDLIYRLRALFRRGAMERELDKELQLHHEHEVAKLVARGLSPAEARREARLAIGGIEQVKEETRDAWGVRLLESTVQDALYALRMLRKSPGFAAAVTLSLALGIGANTAIFTLMDAVMWRLLPVKDPEHLLVVSIRREVTVETGFSYDQFRLLRENSTHADLAGYATAPVNASIDGPPEPSVRAHLVTGGYFSLLGVAPVIGQAIGPDDDRVPNGHPVAMLSHGYWERRFSRDPAMIGRTIRLSAKPFTIIGVTPPEFFGVEVGEAPDLFVPIMMQPTVMPAFENLLENPIVDRPWVQVIARTRPGASPEQAAAVLDSALQSDPQQSAAPIGPRIGPAPPPAQVALTPATSVSALRRQFSRPLVVLLAMVAVVLLIACANTANLLLARAASRRPELTMRLALGAGRSRLIRQLLVESTVLAGLGGLGGIMLAQWTTRLLVIFMSSGRTPIALDLVPNPRILAFTAAVTMATGLLFGLMPAWRATRIDLAPALKTARQSLARSLKPDRVLSVTQVALSLVLLVGAGLFTRSLQALSGDEPAIARQSVVILRVEPKGSDQRGIPGTAERLDRIYRELIRRVEELPLVASASMAQITPTAPTPNAAFRFRTSAGDTVRVPRVMVYANYFKTIGIPVTRGREFNEGDLDAGAPAACVINESFTREFFGTVDPIGKPCFPPTPNAPPEQRHVVVGVVKDSPYNTPDGSARPLAYTTFLHTNTGRGQMVLHARVDGNVGAAIRRIREEVTAVDPTVPMFDVYTLEEEMNAAHSQQRLIAVLSSFFGVLGLVLAAVGLYGLLAFTMVQRRSEVGLRMALGAQRRDVLWMVGRDALVLVGVGMAVGVPAALALARFASSRISGLLFGVSATDPSTMAVALGILAAVAAIATWLPARRASRVDPATVLRAE
jgi:predicted permease